MEIIRVGRVYEIFCLANLVPRQPGEFLDLETQRNDLDRRDLDRRVGGPSEELLGADPPVDGERGVPRQFILDLLGCSSDVLAVEDHLRVESEEGCDILKLMAGAGVDHVDDETVVLVLGEPCAAADDLRVQKWARGGPREQDARQRGVVEALGQDGN